MALSLAHIATVGKAMSSPEEKAYPILRKHDVEYVLIIFGGLIGYSGDDINKFLWMVRIAQGVWPEEIQEPQYFTPRGEYKVDAQASEAMKNSLMYKMTYHRFVYGGNFPRASVLKLFSQIRGAVHGQQCRGPSTESADSFERNRT